MYYYFCHFCENRGNFRACGCTHGELLGCEGRPACRECESAHRSIGTFVKELLATDIAERSNSARASRLRVLLKAFATVRNNVRRPIFVSDELRACDPFSGNASNFAWHIVNAIQSLPLNQEFAKALDTEFKALRLQRAMESFSCAIKESIERDEQNRRGAFLQREMRQIRNQLDELIPPRRRAAR